MTNLAEAGYMDCSCCGPNGVARGKPGALCPACQDSHCESFGEVCKRLDLSMDLTEAELRVAAQIVADAPPGRRVDLLETLADLIFSDFGVKKSKG